LGWARLEAQLRAEVALEDRYSRAGDVALVKPMLSNADSAWYRARLAEVALGWPAPLPAPNLLPLPGEPQVLQVDALGGNLFAVAVLRRYTDSSGQAYEFELVQNYRNLGPGLWEHIAPTPDDFTSTAAYIGDRVTAGFPSGGAEQLQQILTRVDRYLTSACTDWDCPPELKVVITFVNRVPSIAAPSPARLITETVAAYPLIFDLAPQPPVYPDVIALPTLSLAGVPHDDRAAEALAQAISARGLDYLASALTRSDRTARDVFLDALIARAEQRLGFAASMPASLPAEATLLPGLLWSPSAGDFTSDLRTERPYRQVALIFLNEVLAEQPPTADGQLLRTIRQGPEAELLGLEPWLTTTLGKAVSQAGYARWAARVAALENSTLAGAGHELDGLLFNCIDGLWLVDQGDAVILPSSAFTQGMADPNSLSLDGRFFAYFDLGSQPQVRLIDLKESVEKPVPFASNIVLLGWSAANQLLYLGYDLSQSGGVRGYLWRYDPLTGANEQLMDLAIIFSASWTSDRRSLILTLQEDWPSDGLVGIAQVDIIGAASWSLLRFDVGAPALSPDDRQLAYIRFANVGDELYVGEAVEIMDPTTGISETLLTTDALMKTISDETVGLVWLNGLAWSPDGRWLGVVASTDAAGAYLFTLDADGSKLTQQAAVPAGGFVSTVGFSADGRYLAFHEVHLANTNAFQSTLLTLVDLETGQQQTLDIFPGNAAWSPTGHTLAASGSQGVYVLDVASGAKTWVSFQPCRSVQWYAIDSP